MEGQYNNQYNPYNQQNMQNMQNIQKKPMWAAVTSFVLGLVNILLCCCTTYVFAPLSIIFGIVSLAKKWGGKGLSITGIILSSISLVLMIISTILVNTTFKEPYEDMMKFALHPDKYIEEYQETGEVPEDFRKYCDPKYDGLWESMGYDDFEDFFEEYIENYKRYNNYSDSKYDRNDYDDDDDYDDDHDDYDDFFDTYGEDPIEL